MAETPKEEMVEWLSRTEISLRARADYEVFRDELETKLFEPSDAQISGLWEASKGRIQA
ncbi:unnamed protein product, partial [marine sediment metagenome]